jgi:hypothetical protein
MDTAKQINKVRTLDLFCGTKSFTKVAAAQGFLTYTLDNDKQHNPDICGSILDFSVNDLPYVPQILWASPPCTAFSVASMGKHWLGDKNSREPKSDTARLGLQMLTRTIEIITELKPPVWFIENPRGMMRKVIDEIFAAHGITDYCRKSIAYCQYGDNRQKPTDVWTNFHAWQPPPICKRGAPCHVAAPRGSRTGTQGMKNRIARGVIPPAVFEEIFTTMRRGFRA